MQNVKCKKQQGLTLIEAMVSVFVLSVITVSFYGMFVLASQLVADAKLRTMGIYLANEEMERIKSMNYSKIGTAGGFPSGNIQQFRVLNKGGYDYEVRTEIKYKDEEADGFFPADINFNDYKLIRLDVSWPGPFKNKEVVLISGIYPSNPSEVASGGILSINALSLGTGVSDCTLEITNLDLDPPISIITSTDALGNVTYNLPASVNGYQIELDKSGYEHVTTYPPYPITSYNPVDEHATVIEGQLNTTSLDINQTADATITFSDEAGNVLDGLDIKINGGRILGNTIGEDPNPIYSYNENSLLTNAGGEINLNEVSPGQYIFSINASNYNLAKVNPDNPFSLAAGSSDTISVTAVEDETQYLATTVYDDETKEPIPDVPIVVTGTDFSATEITDTLGKAYFWQENMVQGNYQIEIDLSGYQVYSGSVEVNGYTETSAYLIKL